MMGFGLIMVCVLLIAAVLVQNSNGGLQSQAVKSIYGVKRSSNFIERTTWTLALLVLMFSLLMSGN